MPYRKSICLYEVEEELVYRKREVIIPSGSSLISKAFERYVEDILEGDLNNLDLSAGEVLKGLGKVSPSDTQNTSDVITKQTW